MKSNHFPAPGSIIGKIYLDNCPACNHHFDAKEFESQKCTKCHPKLESCSGPGCIVKRHGVECTVCTTKKNLNQNK